MHLCLKLLVTCLFSSYNRPVSNPTIIKPYAEFRNFRVDWGKEVAKISFNEEVIGTQLTTFGNPPIPRAKSSFKEPVEMIGGRLERKNRCKDNIDSLPKSPESRERAKRSAASFSLALASSLSSPSSRPSHSAVNNKASKFLHITNSKFQRKQCENYQRKLSNIFFLSGAKTPKQWK